MDLEEEDDEGEKVKKNLFPLTMFISEGYKYSRIGSFENAMASFNAVLQREPNNMKSLLGRSECYMRQGMYQEAKDDAEAVLRVNPKCSAAKTLKGEAEYFLGDFEQAFITYRRAQDSHPNCGAARLGHQMCKKAIDNALGPEEDLVLDERDVSELLKTGRSEEDLDLNGGEEEMEVTRRRKYIAHNADDIECLEYMLSDDIYQSVHQDCRNLLEYLENKRNFCMYHQPNTRRPWKKSKPLQPLPVNQVSSNARNGSLEESEIIENILLNQKDVQDEN